MKSKQYLLAALGLGLAISATAASAAGVAFINMQRLLQEAPAAKRSQDKIRAEFAPRDAELGRLADQIKSSQSSLDANAMTLSDSERQQRQRDLSRMQSDFQQKQQAFQEDLNARRDQELKDFTEIAQKAIVEIANTGKYEIIFQEAVWANPDIDITDAVLKILARDDNGAAPAKPAAAPAKPAAKPAAKPPATR